MKIFINTKQKITMKRNYLKLTAVVLAALTLGFTSCDDSSTEKVAPTVISLDVSSDNTVATVYFSFPGNICCYCCFCT